MHDPARAIFIFSESGARHSLDRRLMSFCNLWLDLININVYANVYELWTFFANCLRPNLHKLTRAKQLHKLSQGDYRAHSENQPSASLSVDFLRVVQLNGLYFMKSTHTIPIGVIKSDGPPVKYLPTTIFTSTNKDDFNNY